MAASLLMQPACADYLGFRPSLEAAGWRILTIPGRTSAKFSVASDGSLEVLAEAAVAWLWRPVPDGEGRSTRARWMWRVDEGVGPTDLTRRGVDDRALALYFVFGQQKDSGTDPIALLRAGSVRALVYVFGGNQPRHAILPSPHMGARGWFIVLRAADGTRRQWLEESVDLVADFRHVFGADPPALIAVGLSSDSDDTNGRNRVRLRDLELSR
jgi:hypothetical protein